MCFSVKVIVYSCALGLFLIAGVVFADQGTSDSKSPTEQCTKGDKTLINVKSKDECVKQSGVWVRIEGVNKPTDPFGKNTTMRPPDPLEKNMTARPPDPLERNSAMLPDDPLDKNKAMPPAGNMVPSGGH